MSKKSSIALLIDADNASASSIADVLDELASRGSVTVRRAYGNWTSSTLASWRSELQNYAIRPIQQFDVSKGKNATDMAMTIDAMDILHSRTVATFGLVSSDSDFAPLALRIREQGSEVIGFGESKAPEAFRKACTSFIYTDRPSSQGSRQSGEELRADNDLGAMLASTFEETRGDDGWASLSAFGSHLRNRYAFHQKNYGFAKLGDLIREIGLFEVRDDADRPVRVRLRD